MKLPHGSLVHKLPLVVVCLGLGLTGCGDKSPQALVAAGKAAAAKQDYQTAAIQFKAALQADPNSAETNYLLGQSLLAAGDPEGASVELGKALERGYAPEKVLPTLVQALLLKGEFKKVVTLYGDKTFADTEATASLQSSVATAWGSLGNLDKASAAIQAALVSVPDYGPARLLEARVVARRGAPADALILVDRILARNPAMFDAWMLKGEIQADTKDNAGADASFRKTIELQRNYLPAHMVLIAQRLQQGDIAGAKNQLAQLKAALPNHPMATLAEAQLALSEKNLPRARELAQKMMQIAPDNVSVLMLSGATEGRLGSLVVAETNFAKVLQLEPDLQAARVNLGIVYLRLGQPTKAISTVQPLLEGKAESAQAHSLAGDAEMVLGNATAAQAHYKRALALDPQDSGAAVSVAVAGLNKGDANAFVELQSLSSKSKDLFADQAIVAARVRRGEFDAALAAVDAMAAKQPNNATIWELRGQIHNARRDAAAARTAFEQALKLDPTRYSTTAALAALDIAEQKPEEARKRFEASIQADAQNYYARMALAALQRRTGAPLDQIKATLTEAIKQTPTAAPPRLMLMELVLRQRLYKEALALARDGVAAFPNDVAMLAAAGQAQTQAGEVEQALNTFRRLTSLTPASATPWLRLADVYRASGRADAALNAVKKALDAEPQSAPAQGVLIETLVAAGRGNEALDVAREQQRQRPGDASGYLFEGTAQLRLKAPTAAIAAYRKGLAASPSNTDLAFALYAAQQASGKEADAQRYAAGWLKEHPADYTFEYNLSVAEIDRREFAQAEQRLLRIVAKLPDNVLALNNLAWVMSLQGKPGAVPYAQRAVDAMPNQAAPLDTLALALSVEKQYAKAVQTQQRAIELEPSNNRFKLNLARIAVQSGDKPLARRELEALKAMGTGFAGQDEVTKLLNTL